MIAEPCGSLDAGNVCGADAVWFVAAQVTLTLGKLTGIDSCTNFNGKRIMLYDVNDGLCQQRCRDF